ncbi:MAG: pentapeptide repeat-containing protein, partial [Candidatus Electrothrix sp. AR4]|nr:pentapeptide repeat-containing protein [Candidatus Electrothrix sp. AR4]
NRCVAEEHRFLEMSCRLDTLWLFPGHETGILIWRAQLNGLPEWRTDDYYLVADLELLTEPPEEATTYYRSLIALPAGNVKEIVADAPEPTEAAISKESSSTTECSQSAVPKPDPFAEAIAEKTAAAKAKLTPLLASFGISVDELLGQAPAAFTTGQDAKPLTPARLAQRAAHLRKKLDNTLQGTGLAPEDLQPDAIAKKTTGKTRGVRIATAIAAMQSYGIQDEALFAEMRDLEQQADQAVDEKKQKSRPDKANGNLPLTAVMSRDEVLAAYAAGDSLAGLDLSGLDLSGLVLDRADFRGAVLEGVNFIDTSLQGANFSGALLSGADCSGVQLADSILRDCVATAMVAAGADFFAADLHKARFDKSDFSRACFAEVKAARS